MMRLFLALLFLTSGLWSDTFARPFGPDGNPPLEDLLSSSEFHQYLKKPRYRDRMDLFGKVLERYQAGLRALVDASQIEEALRLLLKLRGLSHYIVEEEPQSAHRKDLNSKQVRNLEITIRNLIEAIDGFRQVVPFRYQPNFEAASQALQISRSRLLVQIFGEAMVSRSQQSERSARFGMHGILHGFFRTVLSARAVNSSSQPTDDRFTEKELEKIRLNQKLVKRVDFFLKIAEDRLKEIQRRLAKTEWEKEEENPLEFHTFHDLIHAYERAIDAIMTNIDEKASLQLAKQKDIQKSLKKLNKKILEFIPQLAALKERAVELQDEELYNAVVKAEETSTIARDGSGPGLSMQ